MYFQCGKHSIGVLTLNFRRFSPDFCQHTNVARIRGYYRLYTDSDWTGGRWRTSHPCSLYAAYVYYQHSVCNPLIWVPLTDLLRPHGRGECLVLNFTHRLRYLLRGRPLVNRQSDEFHLQFANLVERVLWACSTITKKLYSGCYAIWYLFSSSRLRLSAARSSTFRFIIE